MALDCFRRCALRDIEGHASFDTEAGIDLLHPGFVANRAGRVIFVAINDQVWVRGEEVPRVVTDVRHPQANCEKLVDTRQVADRRRGQLRTSGPSGTALSLSTASVLFCSLNPITWLPIRTEDGHGFIFERHASRAVSARRSRPTIGPASRGPLGSTNQRGQQAQPELGRGEGEPEWKPVPAAEPLPGLEPEPWAAGRYRPDPPRADSSGGCRRGISSESPWPPQKGRLSKRTPAVGPTYVLRSQTCCWCNACSPGTPYLIPCAVARKFPT